jgi:CheY-like chemotaxis protein/anti-sigma regulatory factor (Ser/Thr protein kinase)
VDLISRGLGSDPTCAADREEISRAIKGASALTQQLLSMRPNATPGSTVSLNQVIKDLARLLCKLGGEDVTVELQLDDQVGRAQIEAPVVQHILSELVRNARDACTRGGRIVVSTHNLVVGDGSIELAKAIPHGHWLVMRVHDTGAGIDPVLLPRVFEQFFTTRVGDDEAGLGLWVVDELARRCQGHVRLTSVPGEGTTVDVYLPGLEAREGQLFANSLERAVPRATVLVVEDNTAVRDLLQRVLRGAGYHVLVASGPAEARAISEGTAQPIQLLLTDVVMSDLTGPLLAAELQRARPDLAVVLMSGYSGAACLQREGVAAGTVFLEKPFTASHVLQTVQQALDAARVSRPARR